MKVHDQSTERRRAEAQIQRTFLVTLCGFWTTMLLIMWSILPLGGSGVWPLLNIVGTSTGRTVPFTESDVFISVDGAGDFYLAEQKVALKDVAHALELANRPRENSRGEPHQNQIFIRVEKVAPFGAVRRVIVEAQNAHVYHVTFLAKPSENSRLAVYE